MMAVTCSNEANIAHVANYRDLCRHVLCRGKRNADEILTTIRIYYAQIMTVPNLIAELRMDLEPILEVTIFLVQLIM